MKYLHTLVLATSLTALMSCTQPGETTGIGAAAGGAIGAGLGAIVGSQTGSAGTGLVMGAAAGAAGGALMGNALQAQDEAIRTQDEAIERQEHQLAAHGRRINEMRHAKDGGPSAPFAKSSASGSYPVVKLPNGSAMGYSYPGSRLKLTADQRARLARGERLEPESARGSFRSQAEQRSAQTSNVASNHAIPRSSGAVPVYSRSTKETTQRGTFRSSPPQPKIPSQSAGAIARQKAVEPVLESIPDEPSFIQPVESVKTTTVSRSTTSSGGNAPSGKLVERDLSLPDQSDTLETVPAQAESVGFNSPIIDASPKDPMGAEVIPPAPVEMEVAAVVGDAVVSEVAEKTTTVTETTDIVEQAVPAKLSQPKTITEECQKASTEVEKASSSKEVADKLFHFRRALRLCPNDAQHHFGLGQVYQSLNRKSDAEFEFREALRLDPSMDEARQSLDKLRY